MERLAHTQSATDLVGDINANLQEMSSQVVVAITDSAESLVSKLNTAFADVDGKVVLSKDTDAETFVGNLNTNFGLAEGSGGDDPIDPDEPITIDGITDLDYVNGTYASEMNDTFAKVKSLRDTSDLIFLVSTDLHYEENKIYETVTYNGTDYSIQLWDGAGTRPVTFPPMLSHHKGLLDKARKENVEIDGIVCLGDIIDGHRTDSEVDGNAIMTAYEKVEIYTGIMMDKFCALSEAYNVPFIFAVGNHDDNRDSNNGVTFTHSEMYDLYLDGRVDADVEDDFLDYYIDYDDQKIRVVVLFCEGKNITSGDGNGYDIPDVSEKFLEACIDGSSAITWPSNSGNKPSIEALPNGYKALVLCHIHPIMSGDSVTDIMNYIESNSDKIIGYICGHGHIDGVVGFPVPSMYLISTKGEGIKNPQEGSEYGINFSDEGVFTVIAVDTTNSIINTIRFGGKVRTIQRKGVNIKDISGIDRKIHYNEVVKNVGETVTIIPTISNVTSIEMQLRSWYTRTSNSPSSASYSNASDYATLDVANDLSSATLTVTAQDSSNPQCVVVCAKSDTVYEHWTIKIPKSSTSS